MATKFNEDEMKSTMASYWRYKRQCPFVAIEVDWQLETWGSYWADVICVDKNRMLIETEVKVSLADLRKDKEKGKHTRFQHCLNGSYDRNLYTHFLYFAVPGDIANDAKAIVEELYPYAGLLGVAGDIASYKVPKPITERPLELHMLYRMSLCQSATLCRLAKDVAEARRVNINRESANQDLREQLSLYQTGKGKKVEVIVPDGSGCDKCPLLQRQDGEDRYRCGYTMENLSLDPSYWRVKRSKNCPNKWEGIKSLK